MKGGAIITNRAIIIVLDSAGVGYLPDAAEFGDIGADTFGHIIEKRGLYTPNMDSLGLRRIDGVSFYNPDGDIAGCYGKAAETTKAKDTTCGHWEIAGYPMDVPFRTFPDGFPPEIIGEFERRIGRGTLGNCVASGTEIIERLGGEHVKTGQPIVYTSADSVFQIAAHEGIIPLDDLYKYCEIAREMFTGDIALGRIIARPFVGEPESFARTENRRDFALAPECDTVLDAISKSGRDVVAVGKIEDIFCRRGISEKEHTTNNHAGIDATVKYVLGDSDGLIFTNLVDFDMLYGHRRDVAGYGAALEYFDSRLPEIMAAMKPDDLLIITADHGCDPAFHGTDHTREYIPVLVYGKNVKSGANLGVRGTFADIGASVCDWLGLDKWPCGTSFIDAIRKD